MNALRRYPHSLSDASLQWLDWIRALARGRTDIERTALSAVDKNALDVCGGGGTGVE
jgi:hypothetical protein